jgi:cytochrome c-type biogenesis protein CcmH/NrfG
MTDRDDNQRPEATELLGEQGAALADLHARHRDCPRLEVLLASEARTLPEEVATKVKRHVASCDFCRVLIADLDTSELMVATSEEEGRVRERIFRVAKGSEKGKEVSNRPSWGWLWKLVPLAVAAAIVVMVWIRLRQPVVTTPVTPPSTAEVQRERPTGPSIFEWEKLPIRLQAGSVLIWRGAGDREQQKYAAELTHALALYRDDNYEGAVQELRKTAADFPEGVEGQLYLGISRLKLQQNAEAVAPLRAAQRLGPEQYRDDATWYLALAYERVADQGHAAEELRKLCGQMSAYSARACSGLQELGGSLREKP